jgi:ABC-type nickel/cobalt efflux system permease component RcnA
VLDFLLVPGCTIDYYTIMDIPEAIRKGEKKSTSDNKVLTNSTAPVTVNAMHSCQDQDHGHDHSHSHAHGHAHGKGCNDQAGHISNADL